MFRVTSSRGRTTSPAGPSVALLLLWGVAWLCGGAGTAVAQSDAARSPRIRGAGQPPAAVDPDRAGALDRVATPEALSLEWSPEPGVYELALLRRDNNPLYLPDRRLITPHKLEDAKVRDAARAWQVLDAFIDLASRRSRMARLDSGERIAVAVAEIDALTEEALGVGGTAYGIVDALVSMRAALVSEWRKSASGNPARVAPLEGIDEEKPPTGSAARFLAQLDQEQGPIPEHEVVPALLGEEPGTIRAVMKQFPADRQRALRRHASLVFDDLKREGVETEGLEPKLGALGAAF
ncbi:MAG: hypothetical protein JRG96_15200 [Deltaproteobacteria bacterium]|nr:hypothetical protein [Deltaproteobacteria bacterium]MBW2421920.1 hypothetical protein [Deltaproteobacteria bacterium]